MCLDKKRTDSERLGFRRSPGLANFFSSRSSAYHAISIDCYGSKPRGRYQPLLACMNGTTKRDKDQEWGTSGVSGWATSIRKCHQCANAVFTDDVKVVSPSSQSDLLQSSLYNVWKCSLNWGLPININKCNYYIAIGRAPPLQLSFATGSPGAPIQAVTLLKIWAFSWTVLSHPPPPHPLQRGCCQTKTCAVRFKAVVR